MTTVEKIHNEVDSAQMRLLDACKKVVTQIEEKENIVSEIDKAQRLKKIGFKNSISVTKAESALDVLTLNKTQIEHLEYLINKYPFHKFITVDELNKICKKYKLIYAPVDTYIDRKSVV